MKINLNELFSVHNSNEEFVAALINVTVSNTTDSVYTSTPNDKDTYLTIIGLSAGQGEMTVKGEMVFASKETKISTVVVAGSIKVEITVGADLEVSLGTPEIVTIPVVPAPVEAPIVDTIPEPAPEHIAEPVASEPAHAPIVTG